MIDEKNGLDPEENGTVANHPEQEQSETETQEESVESHTEEELPQQEDVAEAVKPVPVSEEQFLK